MSQQRSGSTQYANSNVNTVLSRSGSAASAQAQPQRYGPGLVSLGAPKRPRTSTLVPAGKLSVPRPLNLPSLKKENSGNDPNTQLVPTSASGARGSWKQPDEQPPPDVRPSALTAGSNWAGPGKSAGPLWQPPEGPYPTAASLPPRDRHLNPHEYPTLSAAAAPRPHLPRQPVPHVPHASGQGLAKWDEDERQVPPAPAARGPPPDWARDQDDARGYHPPWEDQQIPSQDWRSNLAGGPPDHPQSYGYRERDDHWQHSAASSRGGNYGPGPGLPPSAGGLDRRSYGMGGGGAGRGGPRFGPSEFPALSSDPQLFPPPPAREGPPASAAAEPPPGAPAPPVAAPDPEREAFEAELERVAADMEKERQRKLEEKAAPPPAPTPPPPPAEEEAEEQLDVPMPPIPLAQALAQQAANAAGPDAPEAQQAPEEDPAAAFEASRARAVAMRAQREAAAEETEKRRREAAQAKLAELEERISRRKAEEAAKAALAEEREAAEKAALEREAALAAGTPVAASFQDADPLSEPLSEQALSAPLGRTASARTAQDSLDVNLSSSVARDLNSLAETITAGALEVPAAVDDSLTSPASQIGSPASSKAVEAAIEALEHSKSHRDQAADTATSHVSTAPLPNGLSSVAASAEPTAVISSSRPAQGLSPKAEQPAPMSAHGGDGDWDAPDLAADSGSAAQIKAAPSARQAEQAGAARAPAPAVAPKPALPTTSWRRIVSGDTGALSPREAAVAAAHAAQQGSAADAQAAAVAAMQGAGPVTGRGDRDRRGRDRPARDRASRDGQGERGERGERARGGRGRERGERNRERNARRSRDGTQASAADETASAKLTPEASEEGGPASSAGAPSEGRRGGSRGEGRASQRNRAPREGGEARERGGRGRAGKAASPRSAAGPGSIASGGLGAPPQTAPTRIIKPPGLPAASGVAGAAEAAGALPAGEAGAPAPEVPAVPTVPNTSLQSIAAIISDPPAPSHSPPLPQQQQQPQQPAFVWGNLPPAAHTDDGIASLSRNSILDIMAPGVPTKGTDLTASPQLSDRAVDRPRSAAGGAVMRPQRILKAPGRVPSPLDRLSSGEQTGGLGPANNPLLQPPAHVTATGGGPLDLPHDMPQLPVDLTFDAGEGAATSHRAPTRQPTPQHAQQTPGQPHPAAPHHPSHAPQQQQQQQQPLTFGMQPGFGTGTGLFSHQHGSLWQAPGLPIGSGHQSHQAHSPPTSLQMSTQHSLDPFLSPGGLRGSFSGAPGSNQGAGGSPLGNTGGSGSLPPVPQFGAFGAALGQGGVQFGQLPFTNTPFVPTGKKPDWSTGPIASAGSGSTPSLSRALDSVPLGSFQNGPASHPPGLNRQQVAHQAGANGPLPPGIASGPSEGLGLGAAPSQIPPGLGGAGRSGMMTGHAQVAHAFHPGGTGALDAAAALPDDVLGSELVHRPGSARSKGGHAQLARGGGGGSINPLMGMQGRGGRGMDAGRRGGGGSAGGRGGGGGRLEPSRVPQGAVPNPQGIPGGPSRGGLPMQVPRGMPPSMGPRGGPTGPPPMRPPPAMAGPPLVNNPPPMAGVLGVPGVPLVAPAGTPPGGLISEGAARQGSGGGQHGQRRGRGGRGGPRGERRASGGGPQADKGMAVKDASGGLPVNTAQPAPPAVNGGG